MAAVFLAVTLLHGIGAIQEQAPIANASGWITNHQTSELDGQQTFISGKEAEGTVLNVIEQPSKPMLAVSCVNGALRTSLNWPSYLGRDAVFVDASADRGPVHKWTFEVLSGGEMAVFSGSGNWRRFNNAIAGANRLTVRVYTYRGAQEATFELTGIQDVIQRATEVCSRKT